MASLRSVNTRFWEDPWIEELASDDKLLFLYLLTNRYTNIAGVYELTMKRICFETGLKIGTVRKGLERFEMVRKAYFIEDSYMFLPNWLKNQNLNKNMKVGVLKVFNSLPKSVKVRLLGNDYQTILNDYQTLSNTLLKYEILEVLEVLEINEVLEVGKPSDSKKSDTNTHSKSKIPPEKKDVEEYCKERGGLVDPNKWFDFYLAKNWMIGKNKMKDWKASVRYWENGNNSNQPQQGKLFTPGCNSDYSSWEKSL